MLQTSSPKGRRETKRDVKKTWSQQYLWLQKAGISWEQRVLVERQTRRNGLRRWGSEVARAKLGTCLEKWWKNSLYALCARRWTASNYYYLSRRLFTKNNKVGVYWATIDCLNKVALDQCFMRSNGQLWSCEQNPGFLHIFRILQISTTSAYHQRV